MRGFTLVEALMTMLILAVGLLGSTLLLVGAMRDQGLALRHELAALLVQDVAERIRANASLVSDEDRAEFDDAARALFPDLSPEASIIAMPATGARPAAHRVTLRWREADVHTAVELVVPVSAPPVAG